MSCILNCAEDGDAEGEPYGGDVGRWFILRERPIGLTLVGVGSSSEV